MKDDLVAQVKRFEEIIEMIKTDIPKEKQNEEFHYGLKKYEKALESNKKWLYNLRSLIMHNVF